MTNTQLCLQLKVKITIHWRATIASIKEKKCGKARVLLDKLLGTSLLAK